MTIARRIILLALIPVGGFVVYALVTWRHLDAVMKHETNFQKHTVPSLATTTHIVQDLGIINLGVQRSLVMTGQDERAIVQKDFTKAS